MLVDAGLVDQSNTVMVVANAGSEDAVAEAMTGLEDVEPPKPASPPATSPSSRPPSGPTRPPPRPSPPSSAVRDAVHAVDGADALVGGNSAFFLDTQDAATGTTS